MKVTKRLLSLLVSAVMVLSMIPAVYAEEAAAPYQTPSKTYEAAQWVEVGTVAELKAALTNNAGVNAEANADKVMGLRLTADITVTKVLDDNKTSNTMLYVGYYSSSTVNRGQDLVLDLNGHTLTTDETVQRSRLFGIYGGSNLVITNGVIMQDGTYSAYSASVFFQGASTLVLDGVNWTLADTHARASYGGMFSLNAAGNALTILNSDITYACGEEGSVYRGGIINDSGAAPITLKNSNFTGGRVVGGTIDSTTYRADGGQIWLSGSSKLTAENCTFTGGEAVRHGGLIYKNAGSGTLTFKDCTFENGSAGDDGGALFLGTTGAVSFDGCTFTNNTAASYGGSIFKDAGSGKLTVTDSDFTGGSATYGGQIYSTGTNSGNKISGSDFTGGSATERGGALCLGGKMLLSGCNISENTSVLGGGLFVTGNTALVTLTDTVMDNESSSVGGSIAKYSKGTLILNNVDITGKSNNGGAIGLGNGTVIMNSGTLHDGEATNGGNVQISRDGTVAGQSLSYGVFIINGGSITGGTAKYGGNVRVYNGRLIMNDGQISGGSATGTGPDIQIYSKAAAETTGYLNETTTVDLYDCLYQFGGKIGGIIGSAEKANLVNGYIAAEGGFSDLAGFLGAHSEITAEANAEGYRTVTHKNLDTTDDEAATCTETGLIHVTCTDCAFTNQYDGTTYGSTYSYTEEARGHSIVTDAAVAPRCDATGLTEGSHCENCDEMTVAQQIVPALAHTPVVDAAKEATCTETGLTEGSHCDVCGETIVAQEVIPVKPHTAGDVVVENVVEATCEAGGSYDNVTYCTVCNAESSRETVVVDATGHAWDAGVYTEPTFDADGYTTYTCGTCGATKTEIKEGTQLQRKQPKAEVTPMGKVTLEDGGYRVWNGIVSDKESETLVAGEGELPLEIVVNFKAIDTLEECLAGGYAKWLVDFNITVNGLANGSFVGDHCYLAGNYGSYGWIKIPLDGQTISEGVTYPVAALYDPTLNYKDICKSVKDFTAAIHIDQAILDANPDLEIKLELVMTNPDDATDTMQIGEDLIYTFDELSSGIVAQNVQTGAVYSNVATALKEAKAGQTVILLADCESAEVLMTAGKTLDLNGCTMTAKLVAAPFGTAHVIDSTDGKGKLIIARDSLAVLEENAYLPVWVGDGYRFVKVSMRQHLALKENGDAYLRFFIEGDDATCALQQALADGGADNGVSICVKLNWIDNSGNEGTKSFVFSEAMVKDYAADWTGSEFRLTVSGMENVTQLSLTPQVMAEANATSVVVISGATLTENG